MLLYIVGRLTAVCRTRASDTTSDGAPDLAFRIPGVTPRVITWKEVCFILARRKERQRCEVGFCICVNAKTVYTRAFSIVVLLVVSFELNCCIPDPLTGHIMPVSNKSVLHPVTTSVLLVAANSQEQVIGTENPLLSPRVSRSHRWVKGDDFVHEADVDINLETGTALFNVASLK